MKTLSPILILSENVPIIHTHTYTRIYIYNTSYIHFARNLKYTPKEYKLHKAKRLYNSRLRGKYNNMYTRRGGGGGEGVF